MKTAAEFEQYIESIVTRRLAKLLGVEPEDLDTSEDDDLRQRVQQRAAAMRRARGGGQ